MKNGLIRLSRAALCVAVCFGGGSSAAAPTLPKVVAGQATFSQDGNVFSITNTPGTIINWQSFSVNAGEVTRFIQESRDSAVLNRVNGQDPSRILGALQSNGKVFLINPNGVVFGQNARVDVNGLVASTLNLSDADFLAGKKNFTAGPNAGSIRNEGAITTPSGGKVFLLAPNVENSGVITAPNGEVVLAAGRSVQLVESSNPDLTVVVSAPGDQAINLGQVVSNGGRIGIYGALVNQRGVVNANSAVVGQDGKIVLKASRDTVLEQGSVTSATGAGKGGEIQLLGERVGLAGNATVDASGVSAGGSVLVGGDYQGKNAALPNAQQTWFGKDASIRADALGSGNGGKVVLWSDGATAAFGGISARGANGGNGGLVETSGHALDIGGIRVDAGAGKGGRLGTWLLDPYNIVVAADGTAAASDADVFTKLPANDTTRIKASTLTATNADIVLQARNDLRIEENITTAHSVRAEAGHDLTVGATVTSSGGNIDLRAANRLTLQAGSRLASPNYIDLKAERMTLTGDIGGVGGVLPVISFNPFVNSTEIDVRVSETDRNALYLNPNRLGAFGAYEINIGNSGQTGGVIFSNALTMNGNLVVDTASTLDVNAPIVLSGATSSFLGTVHAPVGSTAMVSNVGSIQAGKKISILGANRVEIYNILRAGDIDISAADGGIRLGHNPGDGNGTTINLDATGTATLRTEGDLLQEAGTALKASQLLAQAHTVQMLGANQVGILAAAASEAGSEVGLRFGWTGNLKIGTVDGVSGLKSAGDLYLTGGGLRADADIEGGKVTIDAASIGGAGIYKGAALDLNSRGGIGATTSALRTSTDKINAVNTATGTAPINIFNDRMLTVEKVLQDGADNGGAISIETNGGLTVAPTPAGKVQTSSGDISLVTHSPLTILGNVETTSGNISLVADNNGALTISGGGKVKSATGNVSVRGGTVSYAAESIEVADRSKLSVTQTAPTGGGDQKPPLDTCLANPNTGGCGGVIEDATRTCIGTPETAQCRKVLPQPDVCKADPNKLGCAAVLVRECIADPKAAGCGTILPTYEVCQQAPGTYGCAPVIKEHDDITACIVNPKGPGCSATLPKYEVCEAKPGTYGCKPVIEERNAITLCIADPKTPGCNVILPQYEVCAKAPTTYGCAPVIKEHDDITACMIDPKGAGCGTTLPQYDTCVLAPNTYGCSAVLATRDAVTACIANPKAPGCDATLPPYGVCEKAPTTYGCAPVIKAHDDITACIVNPKGPGCDTTLPPYGVCEKSPTTYGCAPVIKAHDDVTACIVNPKGPGCDTTLPPYGVCEKSPTTYGCAPVIKAHDDITACIVNPKGPGCDTTLPPYGVCEKSPGTYGCAPVIKAHDEVTACIVNPKGPGCDTTLPPYGVCEKSPGTYGCAPVIKAHDEVTACIVNPKGPGCDTTLPPYGVCEKSPGTYGCAPVIKAHDDVTACIVNPKGPGCDTTLPPYGVCEKAPGTYGCAPVIKEHDAITVCMANPKAPGCDTTLPPYPACQNQPGIYGCSTVIAERDKITACIVNPKGPGCGATLPQWEVCAKAPSTYGCEPVIVQRNAVTACIVAPKTPGCGEILPALATCRNDAGVYGCAPVLERAAFEICLINPGGPGCATRLPALPVCKQTPGEEGCAQVLKLAFDACLVNPHDASCSGILPTLSQCVSDKTRAGCQAVLPTLQQCIGSPTLQGCSVVLPTLAQCAANMLAGCEAVLPKPDFCSTHPTDPQCTVFNPTPTQGEPKTPVAQAQQNTVNLLNTRTPTQGRLPVGSAGGTSPDGGSGEGGGGGAKPSEKAEKQSGPASGSNPGAKNEKAATKMYCN